MDMGFQKELNAHDGWTRGFVALQAVFNQNSSVRSGVTGSVQKLNYIAAETLF
jgi:hypothetical protein